VSPSTRSKLCFDTNPDAVGREIVSNYTNSRHRRSLSVRADARISQPVRVELPYGSVPYPLDVRGRQVELLRAAELPPARPLRELLVAALDAATGGPALAGRRITLIISDPTRAEPRAAFVEAVRERVPGASWTIAIATGTHGPCRIEDLEIPPHLLRDATIVNHDGHTDCVELGTTTRGTPIRVHRCALEADLIVATGCVRPHYFAGFGAGAKAIFPGLGEATAIRTNHRWKTEPSARAGIVDGNPCRDDLEEAVSRVPTPVFLVNGVCGPDDAIHAVVAGDLRSAFRRAVDLARPWFTVRARPASLVIGSDALPVSASLYQAAKIAAALAPLVEPVGTLVLVAECAEGIEPVAVVNDAIFRIGVLPRLPRGARLALVSACSREAVARTLLEFGASVDELFAANPTERVLIAPRASHLICESSS
jgi:hypothetical protein